MPKYLFMSTEGFTRVEELQDDAAAQKRAEWLGMGWKHVYTPARDRAEVARAVRFAECKAFEAKHFVPPAWWSDVRGRRG